MRPFSNERKSVSWENSDLRKWLLKEFYNTAFNNEEKAALLPVRGSDRVSLMSYAESQHYFVRHDMQAGIDRIFMNDYYYAI